MVNTLGKGRRAADPDERRRGRWPAHLFTGLAMLVAVFQVLLAIGMPWGQLTWGGQYPGRLPVTMRIAAGASCAVMVAFAAIIEVRAGTRWPAWRDLSHRLIWVVVAYCVLGVIANAVTPSRWERIVWLPVVATMLITSVMVARGKP